MAFSIESLAEFRVAFDRFSIFSTVTFRMKIVCRVYALKTANDDIVRYKNVIWFVSQY